MSHDNHCWGYTNILVFCHVNSLELIWRSEPVDFNYGCPILKWTAVTSLDLKNSPDSNVHGANMGPTWVLSAPAGPHVGPINLVIREATGSQANLSNNAYHGDMPYCPFWSQSIWCVASVAWKIDTSTGDKPTHGHQGMASHWLSIT